MDEIISLWYDKGKTKKIGELIDFGIVEAGKEETKIIYISNELPVLVNLEYELKEKEKLQIINSPNLLDPKKTKEIKFKIKTKLIEMKPLKDIISIKASWVVS